jgi:hypothetical protein
LAYPGSDRENQRQLGFKQGSFAVLTIGGVSDTFGVTTLDPISLFLPLIIN